MSVAVLPAWPVLRAMRMATPATDTIGRRLDRDVRTANTVVNGLAQNWGPQIDQAVSAIRAQCSKANWDGDDAAPVQPETLRQAQRIAQYFYFFVPPNIPAPELIPEGDGEVSMSWTRDPDHMFSVSIGSDCTLNYAGRLGGGNEPHDIAIFDPQDLTTLVHLARYVYELYK